MTLMILSIAGALLLGFYLGLRYRHAERQHYNHTLNEQVDQATTDLRQELAYREQQEITLRRILDLAPVPIIIADNNQQTRFMNRQVFQCYGYTAHDIPDAASWLRQAYPDATQQQAAQQRLQAIHARTGQWVADTYEGAVRCKDGSVRQIQFQTAQIGDQVVFIHQDVSALREREATLRRNTEQLRQVMEAMPMALVLTDALGRFLYLNPRFQQLTGYTLDDLPTVEHWFATVYAEASERERAKINYQQRLLAVQRGGIETPPQEYTLHHRDGSRRQVLLSMAVAGDQYVWIYQDLTELRHQQAALEQAKLAAEAANQAKSQFLTTMSHELRTPLNGILGFASLLDTRANLNPAQQRAVAVIRRSSEHLQLLIEDLLDLSQIEANRLSLHTAPFRLDELVSDVMGLVAPQAQQKGLYCQWHCQPLPGLQGDARRWHQILLNLLDNAIKYTDHGGIKLQIQRLATTGDQLSLRVSVEDSGIGIPAQQLQQTLQPFEQVHSPKRTVQGIGLGLTICQRLVQLMGGELYLQSRQAGQPWTSSSATELPPPEQDQGTRVWFEVAPTYQPDSETAMAITTTLSPVQSTATVSMNLPPLPQRRSLLDLVQGGDIHTLIETMRHQQQNPAYDVFYRHSLTLAENFRLNELERWLSAMVDQADDATQITTAGIHGYRPR